MEGCQSQDPNHDCDECRENRLIAAAMEAQLLDAGAEPVRARRRLDFDDDRGDFVMREQEDDVPAPVQAARPEGWVRRRFDDDIDEQFEHEFGVPDNNMNAEDWARVDRREHELEVMENMEMMRQYREHEELNRPGLPKYHGSFFRKPA